MAARAELIRGQLLAIAALLALATVAWAVTDLRMAGMDGGPGTDPGATMGRWSTWGQASSPG